MHEATTVKDEAKSKTNLVKIELNNETRLSENSDNHVGSAGVAAAAAAAAVTRDEETYRAVEEDVDMDNDNVGESNDVEMEDVESDEKKEANEATTNGGSVHLERTVDVDPKGKDTRSSPEITDNNKSDSDKFYEVTMDDSNPRNSSADRKSDDNEAGADTIEATKNAAKPSESSDSANAKEQEKPAVVMSVTNASSTTAASTSASSPPSSSAPPLVAVAVAAAPPPPVMKGTLSFDMAKRQHLIRGMWNYENSNAFPPQRFELVRNLASDEDPQVLPRDGEFHGSFSLAYVHTTSKGKQKERSKVIPESGVKIKFQKQSSGDYQVDGTGTNQFGIFHIHGTATSSQLPNDPTLHVVLRKRYEPTAVPAEPVVDPMLSAAAADIETVIATNEGADGEPLPPPSKSFPSGVVCLRGKLYKEESSDLGLDEVVHRVQGMWAASLDFLLADPENSRGLANRFEYEHKSSVPSQTFPVSGRYSGWFDLTNDDGSRTRINERDVTVKFRKNNAGYYNIDGKGSNVFGKYNISGTLTKDNMITLFRHFLPRKLKAKVPTATATTSAPAAAIGGGVARRPSLVAPPEKILSFDSAAVPPEAENGAQLEPMKPPANSLYSAVSRGVLRLNEDGSHSCQGKWAVTREHFTNGQTSNFNFRLEAHFAAEAVATLGADAPQFPVDSDMYKGSFQLKKQGTRYQTIVDQQVVMKFRLNSQGSYNVYGRGINGIGEFNLSGTMVMSGKTGGQVELYRMYPQELLAVPPVPKASTAPPTSLPTAGVAPSRPLDGPQRSISSLPGPPPPGQLQRRESTRLVKLPSKLEDDDPSALTSRAMNKCSQILRIMREKDVELGAFFSEPVDPVALGIPTYHQIIKEPMDLRTIHRRMESGTIEEPGEFARLVRLVFENAITFNVDPAHSVHQAARALLTLFNQRYRDVERMLQNIKRGHDDDDSRSRKGKEDKKRKRQTDENKSPKRRRLEEAQAMAAANASAVAAIVSAAPSTSGTTVSRTEFNMLLNMIQELQRQIVQTHTAVAELSPGDDMDMTAASVSSSAVVPHASSAPVSSIPKTITQALPPERKKPVKRKSEPAPAEIADDSRPLTLEEQELLTETINDLPPEHLGGVIQIIREAAPVGADEDEIDLEIDQLDTKTQRKLLRHVSKFVKKTKAKQVKKKPRTAQPKKTTSSSSSSAAKKTASAAPKPKAAADTFFAFGSKGDSDDSNSDDDDDVPTLCTAPQPPGGKTLATMNDFELGAGLADLEDEENEELGNGDLAANWSMPKTESKSEDDDDEDDAAWGAAREHAAAAKAREAERKAREEKMKAEAEAAKEQRLADAAARGEELRAKRAEEEANEAKLREQQEKEAEEARRAAREAARAQVQSVTQEVDLDAQRDIMKQYEQKFMDTDLGGASPSSDFGF